MDHLLIFLQFHQVLDIQIDREFNEDPSIRLSSHAGNVAQADQCLNPLYEHSTPLGQQISKFRLPIHDTELVVLVLKVF